MDETRQGLVSVLIKTTSHKNQDSIHQAHRLPTMTPAHKPQALVLWVIWASAFVSIFIYQFALGGGIPTGSDAPSSGVHPMVWVALGQLVAASAVRWRLLPNAEAAGKKLILMIIGLSLSEGMEIYGLFLIHPDQPGTKLTLWVLSLLSVLQFIPVYANPRQPPADPFRTG